MVDLFFAYRLKERVRAWYMTTDVGMVSMDRLMVPFSVDWRIENKSLFEHTHILHWLERHM